MNTEATVLSSTAYRVALLCTLALMLVAGPVAVADEEGLAFLVEDRVDRAVDAAIVYLVDQQQPGGWISDRGERNRHAMTSLAIMTMAAVGHQAGDPTPEGRAMERALRFMLDDDRRDSRGYFGQYDGSRMYGHGIVALMFAEMIGHGTSDEQDALIRRRAQESIDLILDAQRIAKAPNQQGGWRYTPDSGDSDLSVTVWQLMALRSAFNAGLDVPASAIDQAVDYLRASYRSHQRDEQGRALDLNSGFGYQPGGNPVFSTTAMGMLAMIVCGEYEAPEVIGAANFLLENPPHLNDRWFYYGAYYYAQGMYQRGGEFADTARERIERILLAEQREDGSWLASSGTEQNAGAVYATSLAVLSLSVKYHYLPIYQR